MGKVFDIRKVFNSTAISVNSCFILVIAMTSTPRNLRRYMYFGTPS